MVLASQHSRFSRPSLNHKSQSQLGGIGTALRRRTSWNHPSDVCSVRAQTSSIMFLDPLVLRKGNNPRLVHLNLGLMCLQCSPAHIPIILSEHGLFGGNLKRVNLFLVSFQFSIPEPC
ncbi:Hypothetical protein NTJ_07301 [Nesidiocoris tenuis]|uniref:Uncharacterized protein n=1 Tax=Nesidiocoris tenuis TaxID=355587 RepID=A0ABN7AVL4_9HEMI|nr:Hypothetical protein NTJ_07301 [Nesidiocoris tenuis]